MHGAGKLSCNVDSLLLRVARIRSWLELDPKITKNLIMEFTSHVTARGPVIIWTRAEEDRRWRADHHTAAIGLCLELYQTWDVRNDNIRGCILPRKSCSAARDVRGIVDAGRCHFKYIGIRLL